MSLLPVADIDTGEPLDATARLLRSGRFSAVTYDALNEAYRAEMDRGGDIRSLCPDQAALWDHLRKPKKEAEARDHFARQMKGTTEIPVAFGRVDVIIVGAYGTQQVVEVEPYSSYPNGVRQALAYERVTGKRAAVAVYGPLNADQARSLATRLSTWCELYLLDGDWQWVPNVTFAEREWSGQLWRGKPGLTVGEWWRQELASQEETSR